MTDPHHQIEEHLRRIARRERGVLVVAGAAAFFAVLCAGWLLGVVVLNFGARPPAGGGVAVFVVAVGLGAWQLRNVRRASGLRRQAERVESARPLFAGELLTVLDRSARPLGSAVLVDRMARRVVAPLEALPPREVVPAREASRWVLGATLLGLLLALSNLLTLGPAAVIAAFRSVGVPVRVAAVEAGPRAVVGDITLRYLYPTYTGLSPMEVPNSNGEIHAPLGTTVEIRARAEKAWTGVALEAFGVELPAELGADRGLRASVTVRASGADEEPIWRFRFIGLAGSMLSPDYRIVVDPDMAPQVTVDVTNSRMSAALDQALGIPWHVHDDYGVKSVVVEVREGSTTREVPLRAPLNAPKDLDDRVVMTPKQLGLVAGSSVQLRLKSWDNDEVSGPKAGWSAPVQLVVSGADGDSARMMPARKALRDALVLVLADFLLDPEPAIATPAEGAAWAAVAGSRYELVDNLLAASWAGGEGVAADRTALQELEDRRRALLSLARALPDSSRLAEADATALTEAQRSHLTSLEGAILLFDQMIQRGALRQLSEIAQQMAAEAEEMKAEFTSVTKDNAAAALARLDQLARALKALREAAAQLGSDPLGEFTNQSADRLGDMLAEARKAIQEGRYDDAKTMMDRIAEEMRQLSDGLKDQQKRQGEGSDALGDAMKELDKNLEALQADQETLRAKTEQAREKHGSSMDQAVAVWKEIEERAQSASTGAAAVVSASGALGGITFRGASDVRAEADGLLDAARSRNPERTRARAESTISELQGMSGMMRWVGRDDTFAEGVAALQKTLPPVEADCERVLALLDKLEQQQGSPALQQALQQLAGEQQGLSERAEKLSQDAQGVARNLPMKAPGLQKGAEQAAEESGRAADAMREGDSMSAAGGQQATEDGIKEAREALKQAARTMQSMAQASGEGEGGKGGAEGGDKEDGPGADGKGQTSHGEMAIPAPEQFETPEAYRRALMEGMQGTVPEQYRSSNLRYYEELVRQ